MKLSIKSFLAAGLAALAGAPGGWAFQRAAEPLHPDFDRREERRAAIAPGGKSKAAWAPAAPPEFKVQRDELLGTPRYVVGRAGFLTGPQGQPPGAKAPAAATPKDAHAVVKTFLERHGGWFGHGADVLEGALVAQDLEWPGSGLRTTLWQQQIEGLEVHGAIFLSHVTRRGEIVALSSQMLAQPGKAVLAIPGQKNLAAKRSLTLTAEPGGPLSATRALALASASLGPEMDEREIKLAARPATAAGEALFLDAPALRGPARVRLVWLPLSPAAVRLCWEVILTSHHARAMFLLLVDAETGEVWLRRGLTKHDATASFRVYAGDSPTPFSPGHFIVSAAQPPEVERTLVTWSALNTNASPLGWIGEGVLETRGNNAAAHLDRDGNDQPDLPRPTATNRVFDFPLDLSLAPSTYTNAAVVNLFYWCNWAHDRLYDLGFTENWRNFQTTNFGRGGVGNDAVQADAQDGDGFNNANFSTPPDGLPGRMQMFIFTGPNPDRDGSLDAEVILHEYCHGLSDRLVGGGQGIFSLQSAGLAEGWSDFFALALLSESDDDPGGTYPFAAYAARLFGGLNENYYYGIRRYPYSTNLAKNPLTFRDIDPGQASSHAGIPKSPAIVVSAAEVHAQGEVWCAMLWDMRANLIQKHGFTNGNRLAMQLVVDGLKLSPPNPNFINARDAILLADQAVNSGANRFEIWSAFARRGLGFFATAPAASTTYGVREDFSLPDDLLVSPSEAVVASGPVGGPFNPGAIEFQLSNGGQQTLSWSASAGGLVEISPRQGLLAAGGAATVVTVSFSAATASLPPGVYRETVYFTNHLTGIGQVREFTLRVGQEDFLVELFQAADFDLQYQTLTFIPDDAPGGYRVCRQPALAFPSPPDEAARVFPIGDDWYVPVPLTNGAQVSIHGKRGGVYISSNGQLALRQGNTNYFEPELFVFFEQERAAALYADLNPLEGGEVRCRQYEDRVAVTWLDVPEYGIPNRNNFQIELFFDGRIRMTWLDVAAPNAVVGLSPGQGVPNGLTESDFSAYPLCGTSFTVGLPARATEGQGRLVNGGLLRLEAPLGDGLTISLFSSDTNKLVVPASVFLPSGQTQAFFDLEFVDNQLRDGEQTVRVSAAAPGFNTGHGLVDVADNEMVGLSVLLPASVNEGAGLLAQAGAILADAPPDRSVVVRLSSSHPELVAPPSPGFLILAAGQTAANFDLLVGDDNIIRGAAGARIEAVVGGWQNASGLLSVQDNEPRNLALSLPAKVGEGFGVLSNAGRISASGILGFNLVASLEANPPGGLLFPYTVMIPAGSSSSVFSVELVDDPWVNGNRAVALTASAVGFSPGAANLTIQDNEIPATPAQPSPADGAVGVALQPRLQWAGGVGELLVNGDFETGDFTGWTVENTASGSFVINRGAFVPVSGDGPYAPLGGNFDALVQQTGYGRRSLSQTVAVPIDAAEVWLTWRHRIRNHSFSFSTNQQFRVELANGGEPATALFVTGNGDALLQETVTNRFNLRDWRGKTAKISFVEEDSDGCLNVWLDQISLQAVPPADTTFEVFLGPSATLDSTHRLGVTGQAGFALAAPLAPATTYYWKVIARRGSVERESPVWTFTTAGGSPVPAIALVSPPDYSMFAPPTNLLVQAEVSSPVTVQKVEFYANTTRLGEAVQPPYQITWTNPPSGNHQLSAVLRAVGGETFSARAVNVIVMPSGGAPLLLVPAGSEWKYLDNGSDQGVAWREPGFADALWKSGLAEFGYGDGDEATVVDFGPDPYNKYLTTYFRRTFTNQADLTSLTLRLLRDDGAIVWLNGQEIIRHNMPPFAIISFNSRASFDVTGANETNWYSFALSPGSLPRGANLLAVEVHQYTNNSPDLSFNLALEGVGNLRPAVRLTAPAAGAAQPAGSPVELRADAFDSYGRVVKVEFFANNAKLGEAAGAPYRWVWADAPPGLHEIKAVATDNSGTTNASETVWLSVVQPRLFWSLPGDGFLSLTWPAGFGEPIIESTASLEAPEWRPLTNGISSQETTNRLMAPLSDRARYFRLRWPH